MNDQLTLFPDKKYDPMSGILLKDNGEPWCTYPGIFITRYCAMCGSPVKADPEKGEFCCSNIPSHYSGKLIMEAKNNEYND